MFIAFSVAGIEHVFFLIIDMLFKTVVGQWSMGGIGSIRIRVLCKRHDPACVDLNMIIGLVKSCNP